MKKMTVFKLIMIFLFGTYSLFAIAASTDKAALSIPKNAQLLFIQIANAGDIKAIKDNCYEITLKQVEPYIRFLTESPHRIIGLIPTQQFFKMWQDQKANAQQPNIAMETSDLRTGARINQIFALSNPVVDLKTNTIKYQAKILGQSKSLASDEVKLGYTVLFIKNFILER